MDDEKVVRKGRLTWMVEEQVEGSTPFPYLTNVRITATGRTLLDEFEEYYNLAIASTGVQTFDAHAMRIMAVGLILLDRKKDL